MPAAKILVVDDDSEFREMVRLALERAGYDVTEAIDGKRALTLLDQTRPDLVLVDVNMPIMSGPEFVDALTQRGSVHPFGVVAMSGSIGSRESPTSWFLSKPIDLDLLLGVVGDFCGRRGVASLWVREQRDSFDAFKRAVRPAASRVAR